jgi:hypothetical protein
MTNLEIHEKINFNNKLIEDMMSPGQFVLNNTIADLVKENSALQKQCEHHFVNGFCEFCYKQEE